MKEGDIIDVHDQRIIEMVDDGDVALSNCGKSKRGRIIVKEVSEMLTRKGKHRVTLHRHKHYE